MKKHVRIAALQCNFQTPEQTLAMPEKWARMGFNTEQLLHTHADLYSAIYDEKRHGELMREYLGRSQAAGVDTIVYMNCHILGPSIADKYEDWALRDLDGSYPRFYGTYYGCCLNSPWRDYFYRCLESLRQFRIEGLFFDGPFYRVCACPHCRAKFQAATGKTMEEATAAEREHFAYESVIAFKDDLYKKVKSIQSDWQMYFNEGLFSGRSNATDFVRQLASDDLIGTEGGFFFYSEPKKASYWHCAVCAKLAEAVAHGKPTVIFFAGDHKPWGWYMHTVSETRLCYISAIGNGASVWYGIHCNPENLDTATGKAAAKLVQFDKKHDALYQNTRSLADIAVFYSYDTAAGYQRSGTESDLYESASRNEQRFLGDYSAAVNGAFGVLEHLNMAYDVVTDVNLEDLGRYRVVLAPSLALASPRVKAALEAYVAAGGTLIADGEFGRFDEHGQLLAEPAWAALAGGRPTGNVAENDRFNYFGVNASLYVPDNAFGWMPIAPWRLELDVADGEVVGRANPPMAGCYAARPGALSEPVVLRRKTGAGRCYYMAMGFFEFYDGFAHLAHREWIEALLRRYAGYAFELKHATPSTAMTVRAGGEADTVLVHLTNYTSAVRPISQVAAQSGLTLKTPEKFRSARALHAGGDLARNSHGDWMLPELGEFEVIVLR